MAKLGTAMKSMVCRRHAQVPSYIKSSVFYARAKAAFDSGARWLGRPRDILGLQCQVNKKIVRHRRARVANCVLPGHSYASGNGGHSGVYILQPSAISHAPLSIVIVLRTE